MLRPAYKLTLGNQIVDTTDEPQASTVVDLHVVLDMDTPADCFWLELGQVDGLRPARDDDAIIELGYADNGGPSQVLTGKVSRVEPGLTTEWITGLSPAASLLQTFVDQTYENKTAGDIVRDLASQAAVAVATADAGIRFPAYVIDGHRNLDRHLRELARLCGFDLYINADGELVFQRFTNGNSIHVFEYGAHIIELRASRSQPSATTVEAWGESPGSGADESWAWLTKDFGDSKGSAGSGDPTLLLERSALRSATAAQTAADARLTDINRNMIRGQLLSVGRPEVRLGDAIRLQEVPEPDLNDVFQVRQVIHRITKAAGFTTTIGFRSVT